jgi:seryl-tRNA synthetase
LTNSCGKYFSKPPSGAELRQAQADVERKIADNSAKLRAAKKKRDDAANKLKELEAEVKKATDDGEELEAELAELKKAQERLRKFPDITADVTRKHDHEDDDNDGGSSGGPGGSEGKKRRVENPLLAVCHC